MSVTSSRGGYSDTLLGKRPREIEMAVLGYASLDAGRAALLSRQKRRDDGTRE
jgi:hypothetical protein